MTNALRVDASALGGGARSAPIVAGRGGVVALGGVVAAMCLAHVLSPEGLIGDTTYPGLTLGAGIVASMGAWRQRGPQRFAWTLVAAGVVLSALGDATYFGRGLLVGSYSDLSVADLFWVMSYGVLAVGMSTLIVGGRGPGRADVDGLIDIGSFAVLAVILVTQLEVVRDIVTDGSYSLIERTVWTAYPVLDAALLSVAAQGMFSRRLWNRHGVCLASGITLWLVSDFASLLLPDKTVTTRWLDVGWMVGAMCVALATWPATVVPAPASEAEAVRRVNSARVAITLLPLLVPGLIEVWSLAEGRDANPIPLFGATASLVCLAFIRSARLVKARNRQEEALRRKTWFYTALAENSSDAVIVVGMDGLIRNDAPNLAAMLGRPGTPTIGLNAVSLLDPEVRQAAQETMDRWWLTKQAVADAEVRAATADGSERWFGIRAANLADDPVIGGMVINLRDITDRRQAERDLTHNALHDSLTDLPNRALFHDRLEHALERTSRTGLHVAVVYLDLDGFKTVNDSRGHEAGDQVLREVASRLTGAVRSIDTVSRHGGDEFAILLEESLNALDEAKAVAERVLEALTAPFDVDRQKVVLSASIGIAVCDVACTASSMMRDADLAMYRAKTTGKGRWAVYEPAMRTAAQRRLELESDLRFALDRRQFRLLYQPIIELTSNRLAGFEALLRWQHPTLGLIEPDAFIPIAEGNGTIVAIGRWVLEEACRTAAGWDASYPAAQLTMGVNVSVRQIATAGLVADVARALADAQLPAGSLILEMTETVLVQDPEIATRRLAELRRLGVRLAIDDFGTGYSSLSYLRQFPIDVLKIDKSFTQAISERSPMPAIVQGLLDLAKTLRIETIAEGIECQVQRDSLSEHGCDFGQGYLFARPLEHGAAEALIAGSRFPELVVEP